MPVTITIQGENASHAIVELRGFSAGLLGSTALSGMSSDNGQTEGAQQPAETTKSTRGRKAKAETAAAPATEQAQPNISTGGERTNPETAAQDAADEQADSAQAKAEAGKTYTIDDVRAAAGEYVKKFTMEATQEDLGKLFMKEAEVTQISKLPADKPDVLKKVVDAIDAAVKSGTRYGA